jgi:Flp pilus assembly secretin CpaC
MAWRIRSAIGAAVAALCAAAPAAALEVKVPLDQARPVTLAVPASGVVVGNSSIAGVSLQSDRLLFVTGRSYGSTNLIVVSATGRTIYEARVSVVPDESNMVMVTRGVATVGQECSPTCRRRPDISDDAGAYDLTTKQIRDHAAIATGQSE